MTLRANRWFFQMGLLTFSMLVASHSWAQDVVISEILADNAGGLRDVDGDQSDWIELYNAGEIPANLAGWALTDDPDKPGKWKFPEVMLPPRGFLLVFASEKNRAVPGKELHTNFKLLDQGEFLGLVDPNGKPVSVFIPRYAPQVDDISHGPAMESAATVLLAPGAAARVLVPRDGGLGASWTEKAFDDAAWIAGPEGIGFDKKRTTTYNDLIGTNIQADMDAVNSTVYARFAFEVPGSATFDALVLRIKYDDGFAAYLNGQEAARRNAPVALSWNSRSVTIRPDKDALVYEEVNLTPFLASLQPGANVLAIQGLNNTSRGDDFLLAAELVGLQVIKVQKEVKLYYSPATPGWVNGPGKAGVAETPRFSPPSGTFTDSFQLTLSVSSPAAAIHYTLDRTEPNENSALYTGPIPLETTTVVRARTFHPDLFPSPVETSGYVGLEAGVKNVSSNLPLIVVDTFSKPIIEGNQNQFTAGYIGIIDLAGGRSHIIDAFSFAGSAGFKLRGSSSLSFPQKNYAMEVWDERGEDRDVSLLGLPAESDWVLHAPYTDKSLMRNYLTFLWGNETGHWAPRCKFVEMYLNSGPGKIAASDYVGVYVLMEKIKRGPDRVDVKKLNASEILEPEITGGYILKNDRLDPGDAGLRTARGQPLAYVYPKEKVATPQQKATIKSYLDKFEAALMGPNFKDPQNGYAPFIDALSFIDYHILTEMTKNIDGYRLSAFLFKDRSGVINMGPLWDFNLSLGNADYLQGWDPRGWYYTQIGGTDYPWYPRLFQDPAFANQYKNRWIELRQDLFTTPRMLSQIDEQVALLDEAQARHYVKWRILGTYVWPNKFIGKTYAEEINFMKDFHAKRLEWMDSQLIPSPEFNQDGGLITPGFKLEITSSAGKPVYTINGPDPRLPSGGKAPEALDYTGPLTLDQNTRVRARTLFGASGWSVLAEATFVVQLQSLVVTEVMYSPPAPPAGPYTADDFEFVEVQNIGSAPLDLAGIRFTQGLTFDFTGAGLALRPGEYAVVARNVEAFKSRYPDASIKVAGPYPKTLSNTRGTLALEGPLGEPLLKFTYDASWYPDTKGLGRSLVIIDPKATRESWGRMESWRASTAAGGSPGADDGGPDPGGHQRPGDLNQDSKVSISDAMSLLRRLFLGSAAALPCEGATIAEGGNGRLMDVDGNGEVQVTDAVHLLSYLFQRGAPPALGTGCVRIPGCPEACGP